MPPTRLPQVAAPVGREDDFKCPDCGIVIEAKYDSAYSCELNVNWHCVDCHNAHTEAYNYTIQYNFTHPPRIVNDNP